jgi:hypothetical protein
MWSHAPRRWALCHSSRGACTRHLACSGAHPKVGQALVVGMVQRLQPAKPAAAADYHKRSLPVQNSIWPTAYLLWAIDMCLFAAACRRLPHAVLCLSHSLCQCSWVLVSWATSLMAFSGPSRPLQCAVGTCSSPVVWQCLHWTRQPAGSLHRQTTRWGHTGLPWLHAGSQLV